MWSHAGRRAGGPPVDSSPHLHPSGPVLAGWRPRWRRFSNSGKRTPPAARTRGGHLICLEAGSLTMSLVEYRRKRDFRKTAEPRGKRKSRSQGALRFVIQKHDASHLHYDFRLELNGVLLSWAVPKGPDLDPANKCLAMQVEDHPLEYAGFEGIIPEGEYGGGTVMLWDHGVWEPVGDPEKGVRDGHLKFILHGEKLHGAWMLVPREGGRRRKTTPLVFVQGARSVRQAGGIDY